MLHQIAEGYLSNDPAAWLKFTKVLAAKASQWGTQEIDEAGGFISEIELAHTIQQELLSPRLVLLTSHDEYAAVIKEITRLVEEVVSTPQVNLELKPSKTFAADDLNYWLGDKKPFDDEYGYSSLDFSLSRYALEEELAELFTDERIANIVTTPITQPVGNLIFRLEDIDPRLYQSLLDHPELLRTMDWRTFEKLLADSLEALGFEVELQKGTKDGGIDLFAIKRVEVIGPQRYLIQAKRYKNKVGVEPVQRLMFLHQHHRVTKACLATTSTFTGGAWKLAEQYKWQLELKDFDGVLDWVRQAAKQKLVV